MDCLTLLFTSVPNCLGNQNVNGCVIFKRVSNKGLFLIFFSFFLFVVIIPVVSGCSSYIENGCIIVAVVFLVSVMETTRILDHEVHGCSAHFPCELRKSSSPIHLL